MGYTIYSACVAGFPGIIFVILRAIAPFINNAINSVHKMRNGRFADAGNKVLSPEDIVGHPFRKERAAYPLPGADSTCVLHY